MFLTPLLKRIYHRVLPGPHFFLRRIKGLIHIGAHVGQETNRYAENDLNVLWVEPNPEIFPILVENIKNHPRQRAVPALLTDVEGQSYPFHISSNNGASSSILGVGRHEEIWPEVSMTKTITVESTTLASLVKRENLDMANYDGLVIDTQGTELLVLKGGAALLNRFKFIRAEAADFELYKDCCRLADLDSFLGEHGFRRIRTYPFAQKAGVGSCCDAVYSSIS